MSLLSLTEGDDEYDIISAVITQDEEAHTDYPCRGVGLDTQYTRSQVLIVMFQEMLCFIDEETV